jgi:hypothetical protein
MPKRKSIPVDIKRLVLHEAGYKCASPVCRGILTLDIHHLVPVSENGDNEPDNLLALCPTCHALHHQKIISRESIRSWKMLLLAINEAYDRKAIDLLLALDKVGRVYMSGDGLVDCAALVAADMVEFQQHHWKSSPSGVLNLPCEVTLTERGRAFISAWKNGDQREAIAVFSNIKKAK